MVSGEWVKRFEIQRGTGVGSEMGLGENCFGNFDEWSYPGLWGLISSGTDRNVGATGATWWRAWERLGNFLALRRDLEMWELRRADG